jgi:ornithine cyclodeaminase/alanine dehydrogenase-like protein (mu-crystallin family)
MALLLTEEDVQELLPMERAIERVEASFRAQQAGHAVNHSRERIFLPHLSLHYMAAALPEEKFLGMKIYTVSRQAFRFVVLLFDAESGDLMALIEADHLGRIRTGAASGVATQFMARRDATRVGLIGTGRQARTQLEAIAKVRPLTSARVFSRDENRRQNFAREMSDKLRLDIEPAETAEAAVRFGEMVITATNSSQPVVRGEWLQPGAHVNAIGANMATRRELDDEAVRRADFIAVDSIEQAKKEAGDLIQGLPAARGGWERVAELHEVVAGARPARNSPDEITLFKSCGIALWDMAVAGYVFRQARERGRGRDVQLWRG